MAVRRVQRSSKLPSSVAHPTTTCSSPTSSAPRHSTVNKNRPEPILVQCFDKLAKFLDAIPHVLTTCLA